MTRKLPAFFVSSTVSPRHFFRSFSNVSLLNSTAELWLVKMILGGIDSSYVRTESLLSGNDFWRPFVVVCRFSVDFRLSLTHNLPLTDRTRPMRGKSLLSCRNSTGHREREQRWRKIERKLRKLKIVSKYKVVLNLIVA